jgi:hypothetical protein
MDEPSIEGARGILVHMGLSSPFARAFVIGSAAGLIAYAIKKPEGAFNEDGDMRPFAVVSNSPEATYSHFLAVPLTAATIAYLFT